MKLIKDIRVNEFGEMEGKVYFNYFNKYIDLEYEEGLSDEYVEFISNYLNTISLEIIRDICKYSILYCYEMIEQYPDYRYPEGSKKLDSDMEVLNYIDILKLRIDSCDNEKIPVLNLSGSCQWDRENGIQILIKDDKC